MKEAYVLAQNLTFHWFGTYLMVIIAYIFSKHISLTSHAGHQNLGGLQVQASGSSGSTLLS